MLKLATLPIEVSTQPVPSGEAINTLQSHVVTCCRGLNTFQRNFEVHDTIAIVGTWDPDVGLRPLHYFLRILHVHEACLAPCTSTS